jgi:hypothetical protein
MQIESREQGERLLRTSQRGFSAARLLELLELSSSLARFKSQICKQEWRQGAVLLAALLAALFCTMPAQRALPATCLCCPVFVHQHVG